jgi:hypothetical protein
MTVRRWQPKSQQPQRCWWPHSSRQMQQSLRQQTSTQLVTQMQQKSQRAMLRYHLRVLQRRVAQQEEVGLQQRPQAERA